MVQRPFLAQTRREAVSTAPPTSHTTAMEARAYGHAPGTPAMNTTTAPSARRRPSACACDAWRRWTVTAGVAVIVLAGSVAGCAPPSTGAASRGAPPVLYVANAVDGTLSRLDARTGRAV